MIKLYDTRRRQKVDFEPVEPGKVSMYVCGPTVYNRIHIGNARTFISFDMIRRYLSWRGFDVTFVQNVTDVDDKIIRRAAEEARTAAEVAEEYTRLFIEDMRAAGVQDPDIRPKATEEIGTMIALIERLIERGHAYVSEGDVYFDVRSYPGYGQLSGRDIDEAESGHRELRADGQGLEERKRDELDFALWKAAKPGEPVLEVENLTVPSQLHKNDAVKGVSFTARRGEIVCIAGIDGNGQSELVYALTGLEKASGGKITLLGKDITHASIRQRSFAGMSHIPEDRHKHGLVLDYTLEQNLVLQRYYEPQFQHGGFIRFDEVRKYADKLIEEYDIRSGQGPVTIARSMSGGNQQKAIVAREIDRELPLIVAVQPTRGLDVGAIEYIHKQLVAQRDDGKAVLLVSLELDEVMNLSDRILVMYEGEIVGEFDPKKVTVEELGLYMAGAKRQNGEEKK